ncbi:MAG: T9SS type A sorting domain-containing protein [Candidatus Eisenbacteria bacterium]|uniref:T9SS type A sorting domain-containing protein n=1 Tax=Eiseniibacteriota bacterium TaxID=2212470 RepID=A0A933SDC4_UNCEI|nr:T9SS type A sorting domain-containing protein [Candidatus Eisenbacteria bacterium]
MRRVPFASLALALLLALRAAPAAAYWPNSAFSAGIPIGTAEMEILPRPSMQPDGTGGLFVAYSCYVGGQWDIRAQHVRSDGTPMWGAAGAVVCNAVGDQSMPALCLDQGGGVFVVWRDQRVGGTDAIYLQHLDANGTPQLAANGTLFRGSIPGVYELRIAAIPAQPLSAWVVWGTSEKIRANQWVDAARVFATDLAVCDAALYRTVTDVVADENGTAWIAWRDERTGIGQPYVQALDWSGVPQLAAGGQRLSSADVLWLSDGPFLQMEGDYSVLAVYAMDGALWAQRLSTTATLWARNDLLASSDVTNLVVTPDGLDGVVAVFGTTTRRAARITSGGTSRWGRTPLDLLIGTPAWREDLTLVLDYAGGAFCFYRAAGGGGLWGQRVTSTGALPWGSGGRLVADPSMPPMLPFAVPDARGGSLLCWHRIPDGIPVVQRVDLFGELGDAEPAVFRVRDVAADQGGQVLVEWRGSYLDAPASERRVTSYGLWRRVPVALAQRWLANGEASAEPVEVARAAGRRALRQAGGPANWWEWVGSSPARAGMFYYSAVVPTTTDSMPGSNPLTYLMVSAERDGGAEYWNSAAATGYSVDNLAPYAPGALLAQPLPVGARLSWARNGEADFARYRIFAGADPAFVPGEATLLAEQADTGYVDAFARPGLTYEVVALDVHGNPSPPASARLAGVLDAAADAGRALAFGAPRPNPAREQASFTLVLPGEGDVSLELFDAGGRRVALARRGAMSAGSHTLTLPLQDERGAALANGVYLARLVTPHGTRVRRIAVLR